MADDVMIDRNLLVFSQCCSYMVLPQAKSSNKSSRIAVFDVAATVVAPSRWRKVVAVINWRVSLRLYIEEQHDSVRVRREHGTATVGVSATLEVTVT